MCFLYKSLEYIILKIKSNKNESQTFQIVLFCKLYYLNLLLYQYPHIILYFIYLFIIFNIKLRFIFIFAFINYLYFPYLVI